MYEIAYSLGIPAFVVENEMTYIELINWTKFFKRHPIGYKEDYRTHLLMQAQGVKAKAEDIFPTIRLIKNYEDELKQNDRAIPKGLFLNKMMSAKSEDGTSSIWLKGNK